MALARACASILRMRLLHAARLSRRVKDGAQTGIESSDHEAQRWAEQEGHVIIETVADTKSGTTAMWARPNLKSWVTDPEKLAQYDGIVAYKSDRLSRAKWSDEIQIRLWAEQHGKQLYIISPSLHWPPANQAEQLSWEIFASQAHEEWKNTSERYSRMQKHLRDNGFLVGSRPFGYRIVATGENGHKTLTKDPAESAAVLEMVSRYLDGHTLNGIAEWLNESGVKPVRGGKWHPTAVRKILGNTVLIGQRKDKDGRTVLKFDGILDRATWARLQERLGSNPRHMFAPDNPTLLSGVIRCAKCQRPMVRKSIYSLRKDGSKVYGLYYHCSGTHGDRSKCSNLLRMDQVDEAVSGWVTDVIGRAELLSRTVIPSTGYDDEIADVRQEISDLDPEAADYDVKLSGLRARLAELRALPAKAAQVVEKPTGLTIGQYWDGLSDVAAKRRFLAAGKVTVWAARVEGELKLSVECQIGGDWSWR